MDDLLILKLGGSAITDKRRTATPDLKTIFRVADQIIQIKQPLILLHGGGSFAHPMAKAGHLDEGFKNKSQIKAVSSTEFFLDQLTRIILGALLQRGKNVVPLHPMSFMTTDRKEIETCNLTPLKRALKLGITPLLHGDIVFDKSRGFSILSADRIASYLGIELGSSKVLFGCDVDGVFPKDPKSRSKAQPITVLNEKTTKEFLASNGAKSRHDASGGMQGKVEEALRLLRAKRESCIFNLKRESTLLDIVKGRFENCTRFLPLPN